MGCQYLDESYELFLLGALEAEEYAEVRQHVERSCAYCLARLREAAKMVYVLTLQVRPARLDPKRRSILLQQLREKS